MLKAMGSRNNYRKHEREAHQDWLEEPILAVACAPCAAGVAMAFKELSKVDPSLEGVYGAAVNRGDTWILPVEWPFDPEAGSTCCPHAGDAIQSGPTLGCD